MKEINKLFLVLIIDFLVLLWVNNSLSISIYELDELEQNTLNSVFANFSYKLFGVNHIRLGYVFLHLISNILLYKIAQKYLRKNFFIVNAIFDLCPGVLASALLLNPAGLIIFASFLLIFLELYGKKYLFYLVLIPSIFIDKAMLCFFIACMIYAYFKRSHYLFFISMLLFLIGIVMNGYDFSGHPRGYFLDSLAIMAAVFSPPLFLYFFYTIYFTAFKGNKDLLFFVSASAFLICLLLSFRQKPQIEEFLPFLVLCIPLMTANFTNSYSVHLPQFRLKHKCILYFTLGSLLISYFFVVFNPFLYNFIDYNEHFAKNYHLNKEIAKALKAQNIDALDKSTKDFKILNFYGIKVCESKCKILNKCDNGEIKIRFFMKDLNYCLNPA